MARSNSSTSTRLIVAIVLSSAFFAAELVGRLLHLSDFSVCRFDRRGSGLPLQIASSDC